jgi:ACS family tartrate transporter-like MFS transporter
MTGQTSPEDQVFAKCERRLIPFLGLLYLISIVDRLNIGFAALTMNTDLGFSPAVFGFGAGIFFVGYMLFQVPANLMLVRFGARRWVFAILIVWGAISAACAFVQGPTSFYILRFLLGVAEAGLFPGVVLYLTYWFPQQRRARAIAGFMAASPLAFIVVGPMSGALLTMDGFAGLKGWQWLFLIEGLPACLLAFALLKLVPDGPGQATWLSTYEKRLIAARLAPDSATDQPGFWPALRDPRLYALGIAYIAVGAGGYGMRLWLPQIVQSMGFSNAANAFVISPLPYLLAVGAMIWWGHSSDKSGERIWHIVLPTLLAALGFVIGAAFSSDLVVLIGITLVVIGLDAVIGPFWSLPSSFLRGPAVAGGIALMNTFGTGAGGFIGPSVIGYFREATGGFSTSMAVLAAGLLCTCAIVLAFSRAIAPRRDASAPGTAGVVSTARADDG